MQSVGFLLAGRASTLGRLCPIPFAPILVSCAPAQSVFQFVSYQRAGLFTAVIELCLVAGLGVATAGVYNFFQYGDPGELTPYLVTGAYSSLIFVTISKLLGVYTTENLLSEREQYRSVLVAWGGVALFLMSIFFVFQTGTHYSRVATAGYVFWGSFRF